MAKLSILALVIVILGLSPSSGSLRVYLSSPSHCPDGGFICANGRCTRRVWLCDGEDDCGDGSDEKSCKMSSCTDLQFRCNNGVCISNKWKCDGESDCPDDEDEDPSICKGKQAYSCPDSTFQCEVGICIPKAWMCDGSPDCPKMNDEQNCTKKCDSDEFKCETGLFKCIDKKFICDGNRDCYDGSDEKNCSTKICNDNQFLCQDASKLCIPKSWHCDGDFDCDDESDEKGCNNTQIVSKPVCKEGEFQCGDRTCLPPSWICNGNAECLDGSDEKNCTTVTCRADEFLCKNRKCIPGYLQCNRNNDCSDESDEENCGTPLPECEADEFHCGGGMCISMNMTCNKNADCPSGEDEPPGKCGVNECEKENGGCSQICVDTTTGFYCTCRKGYKLIDNSSCDDVNECDDPNSCSQLCVNEKGTYKCECEEGYSKDRNDHRRCKATEGEPTLIFTRKHDIRMLKLANNELREVVKGTKSSIALGYLYKAGQIFWSDGHEKKIYKSELFGEKRTFTVIESNIKLCDGLAIDWVYDHIYWSDTEKDTIEVANLNGTMRKTLIKAHLDKPRAVTVSPQDGWMFWSDWGKAARIERAGLDGTHRSVIVSYDVQWPNGLTLDLLKRRLYWIDAKLDMIFSVNYDGSRRKLVLKSSETLLHPFSVDIFEDSLYWTDWLNRAIYKADVLDASNVTEVLPEGSVITPMVVHVYHHYKQPKSENYCAQAKCTHFCLPAPQLNPRSAKISCACPDELHLSPDGITCLDGTEQATTERDLQTTEVTTQETTSQTPKTYTNITRPPTTKGSEKLPVTQTTHTSATSSVTTKATEKVNITNRTQEKLTPDEHSEESNYAGIVIASSIALFTLLVIAVAVVYAARRNYFRSVGGGNQFLNPTYRRTSEDYVSLAKNEHRPSSSDEFDSTY